MPSFAAAPVAPATRPLVAASAASIVARSCSPGAGAPFAFSHDSSIENVSPSQDRKSTRLNSSHANISYAVFCLKKKKKPEHQHQHVAHDVRPHQPLPRHRDRLP